MSRARRAALVLGAYAALFAAVAVFGRHLNGPLRSLALPLGYQREIRASAAANGLEPALVAAVIYVETRFHPRTSTTGALGPMQVEPRTALQVARRAAIPDPPSQRLAEPTVNIAFGSRYLAYLLRRFGDLQAALAAYNAGEAPAERWLAAARRAGKPFGLAFIGYPQTRAYVAAVLAAREAYRQTYPKLRR